MTVAMRFGQRPAVDNNGAFRESAAGRSTVSALLPRRTVGSVWPIQPASWLVSDRRTHIKEAGGNDSASPRSSSARSKLASSQTLPVARLEGHLRGGGIFHEAGVDPSEGLLVCNTFKKERLTGPDDLTPAKAMAYVREQRAKSL